MEDARIVELYWERDEAAIAESSAKYGGYCYQIAFRILALREDAEECVGDTWLRAWEAMPPSRPGRLDTFLGKITRNLSLDRWRALRAQKRWQGQAELALTELGDCLPASGGVEQEVEAAALAESLNRFLESLPQEKRVLFVRRYWYLCSVEELAAGDGLRGAVPPAAGPAGTLGEGGIHPMTREQLLDAVGDIRDAFIREAAPPPASYRKQREFPWTGAVAACLALMIVGSTFFLSQMNMGDGATGSGGASAVTEDTAEVGESGGTVNGAADGTDDSEPETAAITVTVDGTVYVQAGGVGRHPEACPEGFSYAGEAELPDTGELCPYYADPERPGQIYVYQSCWDEGTGTTYMAYVRYEAETTN